MSDRTVKPQPSAAIVADPEVRIASEYVVVGKRKVRDTKPGQTFTALFTPEQEAALIEGGHIKHNTKEKA